MKNRLEARLNSLAGHPDFSLSGGLKGLEKESLRVDPTGFISATPHPPALGSALTHPNITTDYSEALLELITPPLPSIDATLDFLDQIHCFVYSKLGDERLWSTSMPCRVGDDSTIPVAWYGSSNVGKMKHVYRLGLGHRYGRVMQTIAGVHFNYSMPETFWPAYREVTGDKRPERDLRSSAYFGLIRNFQRFGWLIPYLFGCSPAICRSFMPDGTGEFAAMDGGTLYKPFATSLRMSDIGYKNKNQAGLRISYTGLEEYVKDLTAAIETVVPEYEDIGTLVDGEWRQLNANLLQIENEYYSFIRPKQIARSGEKPTLALQRRGVQYIEVRALDVSPFEPLGIGAADLRFVEAFVVMCMLADSPAMSESDLAEMATNQEHVATAGRDPELSLIQNGQPRSLTGWVKELLEAMEPICDLLDAGSDKRDYRAALERQRDNVAHPEQLPSARVLETLTSRGESFFEFAMRRAEELHEQFLNRAPGAGLVEALNDSARASIDEQVNIERSDTISFQEYLTHYGNQSLPSGEPTP